MGELGSAKGWERMLCHESIEDIEHNRYQGVLIHAPPKPQLARADEVADSPRKPRRTLKPSMNYNASSDEDAAIALEERAIIISDEDEETRRVTVWNPKTGKKLSGNAGVFKKNLSKYLRTHPDWVVWTGQDKSPRRRAEMERNLKRKREERMFSEQVEAKRKQVDYDYRMGDALPTAAALWSSLLAVCSEKAILEVVECSGDTEDEAQDQGHMRCVPSMAYRPFSPVFAHTGLTSPAVG